jgi:hypothetical protein
MFSGNNVDALLSSEFKWLYSVSSVASIEAESRASLQQDQRVWRIPCSEHPTAVINWLGDSSVFRH